MAIKNTFKGWLPVELRFNTNPPSATWMEFGTTGLSHPFFVDTVEKLRSGVSPARELATAMEAILETGGELPAVVPAGLIFHISRCGSTLLANSLKIADGTVVVSEAGPITNLFLPYATSIAPYPLHLWQRAQAMLLESLARIFAHYRTGQTERLIIKFASWNILSISIVRSIWPTAPCVILIRDPVEVTVSHLRNPGGWMRFRACPRDATELFGWASLDLQVAQMENAEYCARIIGALCEAATPFVDDNCKILDYEHLNINTIAEAAAFFGISLPTNDSRLEQLLAVDAKDPAQRRLFYADQDEKQQLATGTLRSAVCRWAREPYARLRRLEHSMI